MHVQSKQSVLLVEGTLAPSLQSLDNRAGLSMCLSQREALAVARVLMGQVAAVETAAGGRGGLRFAMHHERDGFRARLVGFGKRVLVSMDSVDAAKLLLVIVSEWGGTAAIQGSLAASKSPRREMPS
jgi:hypothetical protein